MERMKELIEIISRASKEYYQNDREIMTDREYDMLYDELAELERKTGIVLSTSPTQNVGYEAVETLNKVVHEVPLLSLNKTKSPEELAEFLDNQEGILSWKLDGLTVVLKYMGGRLVSAVTRGNGVVGEDITHNAYFFQNIPLKISYQGELSVRGEAVISFKDFTELNARLGKEGIEQYKNPRNLCSGTVRQLNSAESAKRKVSFFAYTLLKGKEFAWKKDSLNWLKALGFDAVEFKEVTRENVEERIKEFESKIATELFASDGLVLTFDSIAYSSSLGSTSKFPRDSIAFKWADELKETVLRNIIWNTSRTGLINPIAVFDPVELEGTTVNRASLHNVSIVEALSLGIGDLIKVYKANMIIPQVAENLTRSGTAVLPEECPECGGKTRTEQINDAKVLYCTNPVCKAQIIRALTHYTGRDALNIEGFSEATAEKFTSRGFVDNYTDIYRINRYQDEIVGMEGFGEKSYKNLWNAIEKSRTTHLYSFIYGLGIPQVGLANAKLLCKHYSFNLDEIRKGTAEDFNEISGFGKTISTSLYEYFNNETAMGLMDDALKYLVFMEEEKSKDGLSGLTFVITGSLHEFANRKELQAHIEGLGGKVSSSVSGNTDYLINNDNASGSSKNKKAKELGIPIITEEQYMELIR